MFTITASMQTETAELKDDTLQQMVKYMDDQHVRFSLAALQVHRKTVFEILIMLIRFTPVDTGRLRGSWTPYLDRYGHQASYAPFLDDASLVRSRPSGIAGRAAAAAKRAFGMDEVSKGKAEGFFTDATMLTTVGSNVAYAYSLNDKTRYFDLAAIESNKIINKNFEEFLRAAREAEWIPQNYSDEPKPAS